jgi:hypothetical protein
MSRFLVTYDSLQTFGFYKGVNFYRKLKNAVEKLGQQRDRSGILQLTNKSVGDRGDDETTAGYKRDCFANSELIKTATSS